MAANRGRTAFMAVILLFICFWGPIELIKIKLLELREKDQIWDEALLKEEIIQEMIGFQNDLKPERYLEKILSEIENSYFSNHSSSAEFSAVEFNTFLNEQLKSQYGIDSLFISSVNKDPNIRFAFINPRMGLAKNEENDFNDFVTRFSMAKLHQYVPLNHEESAYAFFDKYNRLENEDQFENSPRSLKNSFRRFLGSYYASDPLPDRVVKYFVDRNGFQFLYYYYRAIVVKGKFQGMFSVGILEDSIDTAKMADHAKSESQNFSHPLRRTFVRVAEDSRSGFRKGREKTKFMDSIPYEFKTLLKSHKRLAVKDNDGFHQPFSLAILSKKKHADDHDFVYRLPGTLIRLLIILLGTFWIRCWLFGLRVPVNLRRKFVFLLIIMLFPPGIIISFFSALISNRTFSVQTGLARSRLVTRLDMLENLLEEAKNRQVLNNLGIKEILTDILQKTTVLRIEIEGLKRFFEDNVEDTLLYDKAGNTLSFYFDFVPNEPDPLEFNNCVKYLNALGVLNKSDPQIMKVLERVQLTEGLFEGFFSAMEESEIMSQEGLNIPRLIRPSSVERGQYFLIPFLEKNPLKPLAICFLSTKIKMAVLKILSYLRKFFFRFLFELKDSYEINLAVAQRSSGDFEQIHHISDKKLTKEFQDLFITACKSGASGSSFQNTKNGMLIKSWRFYSPSEIMIAGTCLVKRDDRSNFLFIFLPFALAGFSLLVLLLLSELMNSLFLPPIQALSDGVEKVSERQDFTAKVQIENNDEFDQMGLAFNQMTKGLLQRSHLTRFVSNRLVSSLANDSVEVSDLGEELEVTVLCSDLRGFTTVSENNSPEAIVEFLNDYFTEMETAIVQYGGVIDKFIGDAIIAVFYPDENSEPEKNAVLAAMAMRKALKNLNERRKSCGLFSIENGIGIATGKAISGNIGIPGTRMDYTITGRIVKIANDLEAATKNAFFTKIIVDDKTKSRLTEAFEFHSLHIDGVVHAELIKIREGNPDG